MPRPEDCRYTEQHEWVCVENGSALVGITDFAQEELGQIVYVNMGEAGRSVAAGAELGEVESVKTVAQVYAPIGGTVLEVNAALVDKPEAVNNEPFGAGWLVRLAPSDAGEAAKLMDHAAYRKFLETAGH